MSDPHTPSPAEGVGLSGGGIRSATFALGIFQGLAKSRLLRCIDYLSTVSGGGYFGSFFGQLLTRDYVQSPRPDLAVRQSLLPSAALKRALDTPDPRESRWTS